MVAQCAYLLINETGNNKQTGDEMNWTQITNEMAASYGRATDRGHMLTVISLLCHAADMGEVEYTRIENIGLAGTIPSCIENGTDFSQEGMRSNLRGLAARFPGLCHTLTTHDLNSFQIPSIGNLVTEIRMS